jgi:hypothetical protein
MTMLRSLILAFVALLFGACEQVQTVKATQLLITVSSDLGSEVASVDVQLYDAKEQTPGKHEVYTTPLPFSFAIVPAPVSPVESILVVISGKNASNEVLAVSKAVITFAEHKIVRFDMVLKQACRGLNCGQGQTCLVSSEGSAECAGTPITVGSEYDMPGHEINEVVAGGDGGASPGGAGTGGDMSGLQGGGTASVGGTTSMGGTASIGGTASMGGTTSMGGTANMDGGATSMGGTASMGGTTGGASAMGGAAGAGAAGGSTAGGSTAGGSTAGGVDAGPPPDCDATHPCSAGYQCTSGKCVSLCMQTQCDPNANCALVSGKPTCTCKSGFTAAAGTGAAVTCLANQTCAAAGCDPNAKCDLDALMQAKCTCNAGYTGTGKTCMPVACPALTVTNGTVDVGTGTLNQTATYTCSTGYDKTGGSTRRCETTATWSGTAPTCVAHDCGTPPPPVRGTASATGGTKFGATALNTCNTNLKLSPETATTRTCTASGWSGSTPICIGCGDGDVQTGEDCDWANPIQNVWTCTADCKATRLYKPCIDSSECGSGLDCYAGACTSACPGGGLCPQLSSRAPGKASCFSSFACFVGCSGTSQCPPGNVCNSIGACQGCDPTMNQCPSGTMCLGQSADFGVGRCQ